MPPKKPVASTSQDVKPSTSGINSTSASTSAAGSSSRPAPMRSTSSATPSARSTPALSEGAGSNPPERMKFKPRVPIRRAAPTPDIKPDVSATVIPAHRSLSRGLDRGSAPPRGGPPGRGGFGERGRGGGRGRGKPQMQTVAAGVFGGARPVQSTSRGGPAGAATTGHVDTYSSDEDEGANVGATQTEEQAKRKIIDIDTVSTTHENAPTSLLRDRRSKEEKEQAKAERKAKIEEKRESKAHRAQIRSANANTDANADTEMDIDGVKAEPISPDKVVRDLPPMRDHDTLLDEDKDQDRDAQGRRVRNFARIGGMDFDDEDEIDDDGGGLGKKSQKVDESESEEEEEEEDMAGDFVQIDGGADPESKIFTFQFPNLFPKFHPRTVDATAEPGVNGDVKPDIKPEIKPSAAQLKGKKKAVEQPPVEGRIGTLCVMKSGKVKMVLGDDIVMNVNAGVSHTFTESIMHLDPLLKYANVLGDIHKGYVVTPDIDRLLGELFVNGGLTPGDRAKIKKERMEAERGMMKMELDAD